ncbi:uncharacterized protein LOC141638913 [Silene latifolia]|uniref:uncharacterized protein LOC141638913 n=1 Tax=Silene latifolia TaxID=37657 RepID=UPI003D789DEC
MNKQAEIKRFLHTNNLGLCGLLETGVRSGSINKVHQGIGYQWEVVHNNNVHEGGRIWLVWDSAIFSVDILGCEAQVIHSKITSLQNGHVWWLSVVYGFNRVGSEVTNYEIRDFQQCVGRSWVVDVPAQGAFFTWNNKHEPGDMVFSRIDRVLSNDELIQQFPDVTIMFHPEGLFDHCTCTISLIASGSKRNGSFKYFNMWGKDPDFLQTVQEVWDTNVEGYKMFQLVKKLKMLKIPLRRLNGSAFANIETSTQMAQMHMYSMQKKLHEDPLNLDVQAEEHAACASFHLLQEARRSFLNQKAKA